MSGSHSLVVLVEPEVALARSLESCLRQAGFEVLATHDGEECLRIVEEEASQVDAVLAEITMPGVGGREIAAVMAEYRPEVPGRSRLGARRRHVRSAARAAWRPSCTDPSG
jgi:CheY-like chemotaxis protein